MIFTVLFYRCVVACTTFPTVSGWKETGALLLFMAAVALPFGFSTGFLTWQPVFLAWRTTAFFIVGSFVSPALTEEMTFRVLPIPLPNEAGAETVWLWAGVSLVAFVLYHPLRRWIFVKPKYRVFLDYRFLILTTWLGLFCAAAYLRTGSVWPAAFLHWLFVVVWLVFGGGYERVCSGQVR